MLPSFIARSQFYLR